MAGREEITDPLGAKPRPTGAWQPSAGLEGIDAHHSFAVNRRMTAPFGADSATDSRPSIGGYENSVPHAGPWNGSRGAVATDPKGQDQSDNWSVVRTYPMTTGQHVDDLTVPQHDITRPRDPRNYTTPVDRPTAYQGPLMHYAVRAGDVLFGRFREQRFNGDHASFAFTPSLRPSPMQLGDGVGRKRFRPTSRVTPEAMNSQTSTRELGDNNPNTLFAPISSHELPKYW